MLPTHIPTSYLPRILKDFAALIEKGCDPGTDPLMWLAGCDPEGGVGFLPYESEGEEQELDPTKRLDDGEELAVRLHTAFVGDEMTLIDGKPYMPLGGPSDDDDDEDEPSDENDDECYEFPSEMNFYALGLKREVDTLRIRPVGINECSNPGGVFHRSGIAEFPASFMARIEAYLDSLK